jgi:hypothetical protein
LGLLQYVESEIYPRMVTLGCDTPVDVREIANIHIGDPKMKNGWFTHSDHWQECLIRKGQLHEFNQILVNIFGHLTIGGSRVIETDRK